MLDETTTPPTRDREPPEEAETSADQTREARAALIYKVEDLLDAYKLGKVEKLLAKLHSADLADLLEQLHPDDRNTIVGILRPHLADDPEVLSYLDEDVRDQIFELRPGDTLFFEADAPHGPEVLVSLPAKYLSVISYPQTT